MAATGEIGQLIWVVGATIAIAVPMILNKIRLPRLLTFATIADNQLTDKQRTFFAPYDSRLSSMGYRLLLTYRTTNTQGKNLLRVYTSCADPARCVVQISAAEKGPVQFDHVEFITEYSDGSIAMTTNRVMPSTFDSEPDKFRQQCAGLTDLTQLKFRHDQFSEQYRSRGPVFSDEKTYFAQVQRRYDKEAAHQVQQKLMRIDPSTNEYRVTLKWALRMQAYMFNPFADNFTAMKLAATIAIGALPVLVSLGQAQILHAMPTLTEQLHWISLGVVAYTIAGICAGLIFRHKSFIWAFVLAFVPTLFFPQLAGHNLGLSLLMGCVADITYRLHGSSRRVV
jgi:hypothetical protein